ncbi:polysaccharide deacetylase [Anopheles sinensis]|uniref:Polysaccharide deacetylase n=1 Tax=Anopheles sinensis TaxID=74873 RepID=A0A084VC81_ANOSI|nr:polysaccharide deacetylase [Anopheles sinensis]
MAIVVRALVRSWCCAGAAIVVSDCAELQVPRVPAGSASIPPGMLNKQMMVRVDAMLLMIRFLMTLTVFCVHK